MDRFDELAQRVLMDCQVASTFGADADYARRRLIAEALRTAHQVGKEEGEATIRVELGRMREERDEALSGEADAVRRAEAAELGCEIAYRREPTQAEGDAHECEHHESMGPTHGTGECFVPMGGWTGRRCRVCRRWAWGAPTACAACAAFEAGKERADAAERERDEAVKQQRLAWEWHAEKDRAYGEALKERDEARAELVRLWARMPSYGDVEAIRRCVHGVASGDDMVWAVAWLARQENENAD